MEPIHAVLLGILEGLTEFLPISSTGHLILASRVLQLRGDAVKTFEVVIQAGALGAVAGLYRARILSMWRACRGEDPSGRRLFENLFISFLPAAVVGALLHHMIKAALFSPWPVAAALAVGGVVMIGVDHWLRDVRVSSEKSLDSITRTEALVIGAAQCLALWPGTSRAMVTILAGLLLGLPAAVAAEYSFLLALPTLGAATFFDAASGGQVFVQQIGWLSLVCGFVAASATAAVAIRGFLRYLTHRGLAPFGWYRLGLAALVWMLAPRP